MMVYAYDVDIMGRSVYTTEKNKETLLVASKEIVLEVNVDKTKYMVMSLDQNAGRCHNMNIDSSSLERVEEFKYLGTTLIKSKFYRRRN
jgi:hypothetical protein